MNTDRVKQIIQRTAGVATVKLDINEETAIVTGKFDLNQLCNALEESGFLPNLMQ